VLRRLTSVDEIVRYELAESLTGHHHHLVCDHCGRIEDVTLAPDTERMLHEVADATGAAHGFTIGAHHLELVGTCPDCR
jgi:Fe2+ or Zn2+ uptake regulation protein